MIKHVIFDVNKVLRILKNKTLDNYLSKSQLKKHKTNYAQIHTRDYFDKYFHNAIFHQYDLGLISQNDLIIRLNEKYNEPVEVLTAVLEKRHLKKNNEIFKPMKKLVKWLHSQGIKTYILSNMGKESARSLTKMLGKKNFTDIVFSCDVHMCKPDKDMYEYALKRFGVEPEECLFVDDTQKNLDACEMFGVNTCLFDCNNMDKSVEAIKKFIK